MFHTDDNLEGISKQLHVHITQYVGYTMRLGASTALWVSTNMNFKASQAQLLRTKLVELLTCAKVAAPIWELARPNCKYTAAGTRRLGTSAALRKQCSSGVDSLEMK